MGAAATQLELALQPRRTPARQQLVIERLRAVLTRQGINVGIERPGTGPLE